MKKWEMVIVFQQQLSIIVVMILSMDQLILEKDVFLEDKKHININMISTSEIKISVLIDELNDEHKKMLKNYIDFWKK